MEKIFSNPVYGAAFAALTSNGNVVAWSEGNFGGDNSAVQEQLVNTLTIFSLPGSFAALIPDE
ncbi:hypothetical protein D3C77_518280 [compost metagenome]